MSATSRRDAAATLLTVLAGNVLLMVVGLLTGVLSSRWLGPAARGEYAASFTWASFLAVALSLGLPQAVVVDRAPAARLTRTVLTQLTGGFVLAWLAVLLLARTSQTWLTWAGITGTALVIVGSAAGGIAAGLAQRSGRLRVHFQLARLVPPVLVVLGMVALVSLQVDAANSWLLVTGVCLSVSGVSLVLVGLEFDGTAGTPWYDRALVRRSFDAFSVAVTTQAAYRVDALVLALVATSTDVAFYAVGLAALGAVSAAAQASGMVMFSRIRGLSAAEAAPQVWRSAGLAVGVAVLVGVPAAVVMPWLVTTVFGADFAQAVPSARALVLVAVPLGVDFVLSHALLHLRASRFLRGTRLLQVVLIAPLAYLCARRGELAVLAVGMGLVLLVASAMMAWRVRALEKEGTT